MGLYDHDDDENRERSADSLGRAINFRTSAGLDGRQVARLPGGHVPYMFVQEVGRGFRLDDDLPNLIPAPDIEILAEWIDALPSNFGRPQLRKKDKGAATRAPARLCLELFGSRVDVDAGTVRRLLAHRERQERAFWDDVMARARTIGPVDWSEPTGGGRQRERGKHFRAAEDKARGEAIIRELEHGTLTQKQIGDLYCVSVSTVEKLNKKRKEARMLLEQEKLDQRLDKIDDRLEEVVSILLTMAGDPVGEAESMLEEEAGD